MENAVTDEQRQFFEKRGWEYYPAQPLRFEKFEVRHAESRTTLRSVVHRPDGWCWSFGSARFADPISCYVNGEVEQWQY